MNIDCLETKPVNLKLARMTTPLVALHFALISEAFADSERKGKADPESGMFRLDRPLIQKMIGIDAAEQKNCEDILARLGIVERDRDKQDRIRIDFGKLIEALSGNSEERALPEFAKRTVAEKRAMKEGAIKARIVGLWKKDLAEDDPERQAIADLVDVYYGKGMCKDSQWKANFELIRAAAKDSDAVAELTRYIISTNYTSIPAAIDSFMRRFAPQVNRLGEQKKSDGRLLDLNF